MKLLVVDDDKVTRELLREYFEREGYSVEQAASAEQAKEMVATTPFPLVLSDIRMLDMDGLELLSFIKKQNSNSVVILMTGFGNMEGAVKAIQEGAFDYISKPFRLEDLKSVVFRAARHWSSLSDPQTRAPEIAFQSKSFIGKSPQIVEVYKVLARATLSDSSVLITGESGTGKELVARAIHENSQRYGKPFVAVNCGALAENLLESELFGHVKGAFTGALQNKRGIFEEASSGTVFLDEIGDVSPGMQVKLLRVLQEKECRPVGANETRKVDVRIIAATHVDLEQRVKEGKFREDLFYRLKVISIELPALRDRMEDLPELVEYFLKSFSAKIKKVVSHVSDDALTLLRGYPWPGNVRELEHAIERAVAMTRTTVLYPEDFPAELRALGATIASSEVETGSLEKVEKAHIQKVLEEAKFNKSKAASILGIDRKTLHRKAEKYGIDLGPKR